jgi:rhodanese-related sulfurtransferase
VEHSPGFLQLVADAKRKIKECTVEQVADRLERGERFYFIDVREDSEFAVDHAAGAVHLGRGVLERDVEKLIPDKGADIVLYCGGGYRSALAAESLEKMGYRKVCSMAGGIRAWRALGCPMARD